MKFAQLTACFTFCLIAAGASAQGRSMGNGQNNWINIDGVVREGGVLTFKDMQIKGNGWLVIHPFEDGAEW